MKYAIICAVALLSCAPKSLSNAELPNEQRLGMLKDFGCRCAGEDAEMVIIGNSLIEDINTVLAEECGSRVRYDILGSLDDLECACSKIPQEQRKSYSVGDAHELREVIDELGRCSMQMEWKSEAFWVIQESSISLLEASISSECSQSQS